MEKKLVREASGIPDVTDLMNHINSAVDVRLSLLYFHLCIVVTKLDDLGFKVSLYEHPEGYFSVDVYCIADDVCYTIHSKNVKEIPCQDG